MKLYHQIGFRENWNLDSFYNDEAGDGLILAPRYIPKHKVIKLSSQIRQDCLFDPQLFLPGEAFRFLETYDYHPAVMMQEYETTVFTKEFALESASRCLTFQQQMGFQSLIIPTRQVSGMPTDLLFQLDKQFVEPYLEVSREMDYQQDLVLQLVLNADMLRNDEYRTDILNWVTGKTEIDGVYIIVQKQPRNKQIEDIDFLFGYMLFIDALRQNQMSVLLGYCNTEAILLSLADPTGVTMGAYENMRMFGLNAFRETDQDTRGPAPRLFSARLLQWINMNYIGAIERASGVSRHNFFESTKYLDEIFSTEYKPYFTKKEPYMHYFDVFNQLIKDISQRHDIDRFNDVTQRIRSAYAILRAVLRRFEAKTWVE